MENNQLQRWKEIQRLYRNAVKINQKVAYVFSSIFKCSISYSYADLEYVFHVPYSKCKCGNSSSNYLNVLLIIFSFQKSNFNLILPSFFIIKLQVRTLTGPTGSIQFPKVQKQEKIMDFLFFLTLNHTTTVITTRAQKVSKWP